MVCRVPLRSGSSMLIQSFHLVVDIISITALRIQSIRCSSSVTLYETTARACSFGFSAVIVSAVIYARRVSAR
jgi:hypothetical protein